MKNMKPFFLKNSLQSWAIGVLLIGSILLVGCASTTGSAQAPTASSSQTQSNGTVTAEGHMAPASSTSLFFSSPGQVSEVLVKAGDRVKKGAVLARMGERESAQAAVSAAELELASAQRQSDDLKNKAALATNQARYDMTVAEREYQQALQKVTDLDTKEYKTKLDSAKDAVSKAKDDLKTAQENFDKVKDQDQANTNRKSSEDTLKDVQKRYDTALHDRDLLINDLDQAKALVDASKAKMDDARRTSDNRRNGVDPADQAIADARLKNAKNQLAAAQAALARLDLVAPYDCTVAKVDLTAGDKVTPNQIVMIVADFSKWYVDTSDLAEKDVVAIQVGQKATVIPDATPDLKLNGTVESIGQVSVLKSGDVTYVVRITLDDVVDARLRWGMTVKVSFKSK
jgi:multidrug resistance efflux pump